jgi:hypothetical protein
VLGRCAPGDNSAVPVAFVLPGRHPGAEVLANVVQEQAQPGHVTGSQPGRTRRFEPHLDPQGRIGPQQRQQCRGDLVEHTASLLAATPVRQARPGT